MSKTFLKGLCDWQLIFLLLSLFHRSVDFLIRGDLMINFFSAIAAFVLIGSSHATAGSYVAESCRFKISSQGSRSNFELAILYNHNHLEGRLGALGETSTIYKNVEVIEAHTRPELASQIQRNIAEYSRELGSPITNVSRYTRYLLYVKKPNFDTTSADVTFDVLRDSRQKIIFSALRLKSREQPHYSCL